LVPAPSVSLWRHITPERFPHPPTLNCLLIVSEAEVVNLDGNGRFLISKRLLKKAEIEQDIQFIGMDDTIEIWSPQNLKQTLQTEEEFGKEFEDIMNASEAL